MPRVVAPDPLRGGLRAHARRLRSGASTVESCVEAFLRRIDCLDDAIGAYVQVLERDALAQARRLDRLLREGVDLGPIMGVPVALKENIRVDGADCLGGTAVDVSDAFPSEGAFVASLRRAGAVVLGTTSMCELAMGGVGTNVLRRATLNPWDSRTPRACGGSSSGSAAAVAAGLCGFAVGTDTGGSVRSPSAFTGIVGYRPTQSVWSRSGVLPLAPSFDTIGTLARSVEDTRVVVSALADERTDSRRTAIGARIGFAPESIARCAPGVGAAIRRAIRRLETRGLHFVEVGIPSPESIDRVYEPRLREEFFATFGAQRFDRGTGISNPDVADRVAAMRALLDAPAPARPAEPEAIAAEDLFERCDVLMLPTKYHLAPPLPPLGDPRALRATAQACVGPTRLANVLDLCAITTPILDPDAMLPVGIQWLCRPGHDARLLRFARKVERILGRIPPAPVDGFCRPRSAR